MCVSFASVSRETLVHQSPCGLGIGSGVKQTTSLFALDIEFGAKQGQDRLVP